MPLIFLSIYEKLIEFRYLSGGLTLAVLMIVLGLLAPMPPLVKALAVGLGATCLLAGLIEQARVSFKRRA